MILVTKNNSLGERKYSPIWEAISKVPVGTEVPVKVHRTAAATLVQAVSKEKSQYNAIRTKLQMPRAGKLIVKREEPDDKGYQIIKFSLEWDSRKL